jgi:hypothetical protein
MGKAKKVKAAKKTNGEKRHSVDATTFVTAWQKADSIDAFLKTTSGFTKNYARARASAFRRKGIPLQSFPSEGRGGAKLDIAALSKLAKSLA